MSLREKNYDNDKKISIFLVVLKKYYAFRQKQPCEPLLDTVKWYKMDEILSKQKFIFHNDKQARSSDIETKFQFQILTSLCDKQVPSEREANIKVNLTAGCTYYQGSVRK